MGKEFYTDSGLAQLSEGFIHNTFKDIEGAQQKLGFFERHIKELVDMLPPDPVAQRTFALGFLTSAELYPTKISKIYFVLGSLCFLEVHKRGVQIFPDGIADLMEKAGFPSSEEQRKKIEIRKILSIDEAMEACKKSKEEGKKVGLVHGDFRLLTPNHLVFLILASRECDSLFVGVERGERTNEHKGKRILFTDDEREEIFGLALRDLPITPFWIDNRIPYSNEGYTNLVQRFSPSVYIGQRGDPKERKEAMKQRASLLPSTKYVELPLIESLHTSHVEDLIFTK